MTVTQCRWRTTEAKGLSGMEVGIVRRMVWIVTCCGVWMFGTSANGASFDCAKGSTKVEHMICDDADISKLDETLFAEYSLSEKDPLRADATRFAQKEWLKERNRCENKLCLDDLYRGRIKHLKAANQAAEKFTGAEPVRNEQNRITNIGLGKFKLISNELGGAFCQRLLGNLNQFSSIDFDKCNPRLSPNFPEFSRPTWTEIPFDLKLAEKAIRSTVDHSGYNPHESDEDKVYWSNEGDKRWQQWLSGSESLRQAGKARMWITKIDIDGDGMEDTILRMTPGGRFRIDPLHPSLFTCDYNVGELYEIESKNLSMLSSFNSFVSAFGPDIIRNAEDGKYYMLGWVPSSSAGFHMINEPLSGPFGKRGVAVFSLYRKHPDDDMSPASICLIDWFPIMGNKPIGK